MTPTTSSPIILLVAMAENRVIGKNNAIPWHIPEEVAHFKRTTMGHALVMGRKTYDSIGHPLPGRTNIVITNQADLKIEGCKMASSLQEALDIAKPLHEKIFIIGGGEIFKQSMALADSIYLSIIHREVAGDIYFPEFSESEFVKTYSEYVEASEPYTFEIHERPGALKG
ncbi:MAG: dihydrofolate reductase [Thermodesulfobacteriota bacterium]